jgi:hypothetical protein
LTTQPQSSQPPISNITASIQWYALKKKLHPEQRDELDTLLVSFFVETYLLDVYTGQDTALGQQVKLFACVLALESKLNTIQSATPPYQLSDELKVCINDIIVLLPPLIPFYRPISITMV